MVLWGHGYLLVPVALGQAAWLSPGLPEEGAMGIAASVLTVHYSCCQGWES